VRRWILLAQCRNSWPTFVNTVMNLRAHRRWEISWLGDRLPVSQKGLHSVEIVIPSINDDWHLWRHLAWAAIHSGIPLWLKLLGQLEIPATYRLLINFIADCVIILLAYRQLSPWIVGCISPLQAISFIVSLVSYWCYTLLRNCIYTTYLHTHIYMHAYIHGECTSKLKKCS
jgi:hypothetical protein